MFREFNGLGGGFGKVGGFGDSGGEEGSEAAEDYEVCVVGGGFGGDDGDVGMFGVVVETGGDVSMGCEEAGGDLPRDLFVDEFGVFHGGGEYCIRIV